MTSEQSEAVWRRLAKWLRVAGGVGFVGFFVAHFALLAYYSYSRSEIPLPERNWKTGLTWTHPLRYGTDRDEAVSLWLFNLGFPSFGLMIAGELIRIYKLRDHSGISRRTNPPWNHRWGAIVRSTDDDQNTLPRCARSPTLLKRQSPITAPYHLESPYSERCSSPAAQLTNSSTTKSATRSSSSSI
jgi:hypothetical protein